MMGWDGYGVVWCGVVWCGLLSFVAVGPCLPTATYCLDERGGGGVRFYNRAIIMY